MTAIVAVPWWALIRDCRDGDRGFEFMVVPVLAHVRDAVLAFGLDEIHTLKSREPIIRAMNADRSVLNDRRICIVSIGTGKWFGESHLVHGPLLYSNDLQSLEVDPHLGSRELHEHMRTLCSKWLYILVEGYI